MLNTMSQTLRAETFREQSPPRPRPIRVGDCSPVLAQFRQPPGLRVQTKADGSAAAEPGPPPAFNHIASTRHR